MAFEALIDAVADVTAAWEEWVRTHDRNAAEVLCCHKSRELFAALDRLHDVVLRKVM